MKCSRRDLSVLLPALLGAGKADAADEDKLLPTMTVNRDEGAVTKFNASLQRRYFRGLTHEKVPVQLHETELPPGEGPHPPHKHAHEEMILIREGTMEVFIEGRPNKKITPGGWVYVAANELHGWHNAGNTRARYFVLAIGHD